MGRKRLRFNPYTVSDRLLLDCLPMIRWGNEYDITEMVILHFTRLREVADYRKFDGVYMKLGNSSEEIFLPNGALKNPITANNSLMPERTWLGKRKIRNTDDIENMVGKSFFVSRVIRGYNIRGKGAIAYRMCRITGKRDKDASMIRQAMCDAKMEMLGRMLKYPQSPDYLSCSKGLFNYESRIKLALQLISHFHETIPPF